MYTHNKKIIIIILFFITCIIFYVNYNIELFNTIESSDKKIILLTQYYVTDLENRQQELDETLINNINHPLINEIHLFVEKDYNFDSIQSKVTNFNKVKLIKTDKRLNYKMCFDYSNKNIADNNIVILANSDIYFNKTLSNIFKENLHNTFLAITRYELPDLKIATAEWSSWSQDVWVWQSPLNIVKNNTNLDYFNNGITLGLWGCDNRILKIVKDAGYSIKNPCNKIICIHNHKSDKREDNRQRVPGPYELLSCLE